MNIEIRHRKSSFYFTMIFFPVLVIAFGYYVFFSGSSQVTSNTKLIFYVSLTYSIYQVYTALKNYKANRPVLIISDFSIELFGDYKSNLFLWQDINRWKIDYEDGGRKLFIETHNIKTSVSLEYLDKTPEEIQSILSRFLKS